MNGDIDASEWVVWRTRHDRRRLTVIFTAADPLPSWLARLRRIVPGLGREAPAVQLGQVRHSGRVELGVMGGREAWRILHSLRSEEIKVEVEDASEIRLLPVNRVTGMALIIEDEAQSEAFCHELMANGCKVEEVEA